MPEILIILSVVLSATSKQPSYEDLGVIKDMPTCKKLEQMLNLYTAEDPDIVFVCREVKAAKA